MSKYKFISGYDWRNTTLKWSFEFNLIDPMGLDLNYKLENHRVIGQLEGVLLDTVKISEGYYTDERISCQLDYVGENENRWAWLEIRAINNSDKSVNVLGLFIPKTVSVDYSDGVKVTHMTYGSVLYGLSCEHGRDRLICHQGEDTLTNIKKCMVHTPAFDFGRTQSQCNNVVFASTVALDDANSELQNLFDICNATGNRVMLMRRSLIYVTAHDDMKTRTPICSYSLVGTDNTFCDGISLETDYLGAYMDCVVVATTGTDDDKQTLIGVAYTDNDFESEYQKRGYVNTLSKTVSNLDPFTQDEANAQARSYLSLNTNKLNRIKIRSFYHPYFGIGEVIELRDIPNLNGYEGTHRFFIQSIEWDVSNMMMDLTLKDVNSGEDE